MLRSTGSKVDAFHAGLSFLQRRDENVNGKDPQLAPAPTSSSPTSSIAFPAVDGGYGMQSTMSRSNGGEGLKATRLNGQRHTSAHGLGISSPASPKLTQLPTLAIPKLEPRPFLGTSSTSNGAFGLGSDLNTDVNTFLRPNQDSTTPTPETPASLASPIVGVVDLTAHVKTTSPTPVGLGGYSDIYQGVWERRDPNSGGCIKELIAIKLLRILSSGEEADAKARKRLNREVYIWHRLEHPNIVTFLGTTYHMGGRPAMVMQWLQNGSALDFLRKNKDADRLALVADVARGLSYLHTLKPFVVHGDLKSNNVLITDDQHAVLSDFGLSEVIEDLNLIGGNTGITLSSAHNACPLRWQAPEFVSLGDATVRPSRATDVWAFACTAYEIITGKLPYPHRKRDIQVIADIQNGVLPHGPEAESSGPDYPLWALLKECWNLDPLGRIEMVNVRERIEELIGSSDVIIPCYHYNR